MGLPPPSARLPLLLIAMLVATFGVLSNRAAMKHSPTIDEPLRFMAAYYNRFESDFRLDRENPPLCNYWAMLPHNASALKPNPAFTEMDRTFQGYQIATGLLFQTPSNDGASLILRSRAMMLFLGLALGIVLTCWSWQWGGPIAGVVACVLYTFDPNFLGHSPLLKNDVAIALAIVNLAWVARSVGRRVTWWNLSLLAMFFSLTLLTKFSGPIAGLMLAGIFMVRIYMPLPWPVLGIEVRSRLSALGVVIGMGILCIAVAWVMIWAGYGFRYAASPRPGAELDLGGTIHLFQRNVYFLENGRFPTDEQLPGLPIPLSARVVRFMDSHHLLPQACLDGFLYTYATTLVRQGYLLGEFSMTGWWYYFPLAMLFKTPLATLAAMIAALMAAISAGKRLNVNDDDRWSFICVVLPLVIYGYFALTSHLNLGVRYVLPIYPFLYLLIGWVVSKAIRVSPRRWAPVAGVLAIGLIAESLAAFPHYLSFFNAAARPYRLTLLSDSNFDWGQDLTYIAAWQKANPTTPLYLAYWGPADPRFYGIRYTNLPGGFALGRTDPPPDMTQPGVVMVSATILQGVNQPDTIRDYYAPLRERSPDGIIGDSIYLFKWNLD